MDWRLRNMQPFAERLDPLFITTGDMASNKQAAVGDQDYDSHSLSPVASLTPAALTPTAAHSSWFEVRVLYLRVSSCPCLNAPEFLSMKYPPRCISTALEVNGGRVAPSEEAVLLLRRNRVDQESKEVTYVSTENLRVSGNVSFEISHKGDVLLSGSLSHSNSCSDLLVHDDLESPGGSSQSCNYDSQLGWTMDCTCSIETLGCVFLKAKQDFQLGVPAPTMEVCVVGHYCGRPVMLDQSVTLTVRRRSMRRRLSNLNVILEEDEAAKVVADEPSPPSNRQLLLRDVGENALYAALPDKALERLGSYYAAEQSDGGYTDADDSELSWFNAGVRIGVGVGMGMCVGVGIGVGLLVRTYQATSRSFRKGLL